MNPSAKTVLLAATVSVIVSSGTVVVYNSFGKASLRSGEVGIVEEGKAPQMARLSDALDGIQKELAEVRKGFEGAQTATEARVRQAEARIAEIEGAAEKEEGKPGGKAQGEATAQTDEEALQAIGKAFEELEKQGFTSYYSPSLSTLVEKIRGMGERGVEFLLDQLGAENGTTRFVAAAALEKLKDPSTIKDLERAALEDKDFLVRRMSSHALAFMEHADAGDALAKIVEKETRDGGVRLNAWYGLANLKRPEAAQTFENLLDEAGGDIPADFVVDTALKVSDTALLAPLRAAYDRKSVSNPMKAKILRVLGEAPSGEYREFLGQIAADANAPEELRKAAEEGLKGK